MPKPRLGKSFLWLFFFTASILFGQNLKAQDFSIKLGASTISIDERYSIALQAQSVPLEDYSAFPEIPGFTKVNTSNNTFTDYQNGENTTVYSFIQFYRPEKPGVYTLPAFKLKTNGRTVNSPGTTITVTDANGSAPAPSLEDPLAEIYRQPSDEIANLEPRGKVFFGLSTDRKEVWVGQGFTVTLALYVADNNTEEMDFYSVAEQLQIMQQQLKPANCWEEDFGITEIQEIPVKIKGKRYSQFKIFQATYFPLNTDAITFSPVALKMLSGSEYLDQPNSSDFRTYFTTPVTVRVKDLPDHPLKGSVPVGLYRLVENISRGRHYTGKSFTYRFSIRGEGNISALEAPEVPPGLPFDIFRPNSSQNIFRSLGRVTGEKTFSYNIIPQEPGVFSLADGFQWIFFNTARGTYDTLVSSTRIKVTGESQEPTDMYGGTTDPFYADLKERNNGLKSLDRNKRWKEYANWSLAILGVAGLTLTFISGRKKKST